MNSCVLELSSGFIVADEPGAVHLQDVFSAAVFE